MMYKVLLSICLFTISFLCCAQQKISFGEFLNKAEDAKQYSKDSFVPQKVVKSYVNKTNLEKRVEQLLPNATKNNIYNTNLIKNQLKQGDSEGLDALSNFVRDIMDTIADAENTIKKEAKNILKGIDSLKAKSAIPVNSLIVNTRDIKFGLGIGFNYALENQYDPSISSFDSTLKIQQIPRASFVISSTLSFAIYGKTGRNFRTLNISGMKDKLNFYQRGEFEVKYDKSTGKPVYLFSPNTINLILSLNLKTFQDNLQNGVDGFNLRINGGAGFSYSISSTVQLALLYELTKTPILRNYVSESSNAKLTVDDGVVTNLSNRSDLFYEKYIPSISIKFIILPFGF